MKKVIVLLLVILVVNGGNTSTLLEFNADTLSMQDYQRHIEYFLKDNDPRYYRWFSTLQTLKCFDVRVEASSELGTRYRAKNAIDGNFSTAWVEGKEGPGVDEWIKITIQRKKQYKDMELSLGDIYIFGGIADEKYFGLNNRIKKLLCILRYKGKTAEFYINLKDERNVHTPVLFIDEHYEGLKTIDSYDPYEITFEIKEVYKGTKWDDTPAAEINIRAMEYDVKKSW